MGRYCRCALALLLAGLMSGQSQAEVSHHTSPNFSLRTDLSEHSAERLLNVLEASRPVHRAGLGLARGPAAKIDIVVLKSRAAFNELGRRYSEKIVGAFGATTRDGILAYYAGSRPACVGLLMHELTHAYFRAAGVRPAVWLNEGLACYFSGVRRAGGRTTFWTSTWPGARRSWP